MGGESSAASLPHSATGEATDAAACWVAMDAKEIPSKASLHRAFMAVLEPPPVYERHNTGQLYDEAAPQVSGAEEQHPCRRVLDLGCGDGHIAVQLAEQCSHPEVM